MKVDNIFDNYSVNKKALSDYGFIKMKDGYCLKKDLENFDFYVKFIIGNNTFDVKVFEANGEEYLPFYIKKAGGSYSKKIKEAVELMINDIICHCFESINIREELLRYLKKKYDTNPNYPWKSDPTSITLKTNETNKWYGLIMNIPYKSLKIEKEGKIDVLNVKNKPAKIEHLIDFKHYFPAYHMNKKYWISILLDSTIDLNSVINLLDESYEIVDLKNS